MIYAYITFNTRKDYQSLIVVVVVERTITENTWIVNYMITFSW